MYILIKLIIRLHVNFFLQLFTFIELPDENIYVKSTSKFTWITWMNIYSRSIYMDLTWILSTWMKST